MHNNRITARTLAKLINMNCKKFEYFWAAGLIRETLKLWQIESNYNMLCDTARTMAGRYIGDL